jgi:hypothetical protein
MKPVPLGGEVFKEKSMEGGTSGYTIQDLHKGMLLLRVLMEKNSGDECIPMTFTRINHLEVPSLKERRFIGSTMVHFRGEN